MIFFDKIFNKKDSIDKLIEHKMISFSGDVNQLIEDESEAEFSPWYIRLFVGASAWISAVLFVVFLFSVKLITERGSLYFGILFLILAIGLSRYGKKHDFFDQLSIALNFSGHACFVIGLGARRLELWKILCVLIFLEAIVFVLCRDILQRFLSIFSIPLLLAFIFKEFALEGLIHFLIICLALCVVLLFEKEEIFLQKKYLIDFEKPLQFASIFSLLGLMAFSFILPNDLLPIPYWYISGIGLSLVVAYFGYLQINFFKQFYLYSPENLFGIVFILVVGLVSLYSPGIPAAILVLQVGFSRKNPFLFGSAMIFLVTFLVGYYYNLQLTLLEKSIALVLSGGFFFSFRYFFITKYFSVGMKK